ncbi:hypothetical protein L0244_19985 [bacterium]|nr:hypothetical protein [bacterium]MCI0615278.1 hypothetical protein [bacterium]
MKKIVSMLVKCRACTEVIIFEFELSEDPNKRKKALSSITIQCSSGHVMNRPDGSFEVVDENDYIGQALKKIRYENPS